MSRINQQALKTELAKRGFESMSIKRELPGGRIEVEANKLHPVPVEAGESIYAPVPVSLSVALDPRGRIKSIDGDTPDPAAIADAAEGGDRSVHAGSLLGAGDANGSRGVDSSCIAGTGRKGCGIAAPLDGLSCSSSAMMRRIEARISSIEGSSFLAGCVMGGVPLTAAEVLSTAATSAESAPCAGAGEL